MAGSCFLSFLKQIDSDGMDSFFDLKIRQDQQDLMDSLFSGFRKKLEKPNRERASHQNQINLKVLQSSNRTLSAGLADVDFHGTIGFQHFLLESAEGPKIQ
jgi:hypothetical protein